MELPRSKQLQTTQPLFGLDPKGESKAMPTPKATQRGAVASPPASANNTVKRTRTVRPRTHTATAASDETGRDLVALRAYFHWLERGCPDGSSQEDWLWAERELQSQK